MYDKSFECKLEELLLLSENDASDFAFKEFDTTESDVTTTKSLGLFFHFGNYNKI